jgi:hypothetical protein
MEIINETDIPKVIQNSDVLYKSDVEWVKDIPYQEPNDYEKDMLKDSSTVERLLEGERLEAIEKEEKILLMTEEEKNEEKKKNLLTIFKVVVANRLGHHPLVNISNLQPSQKEAFMGNIKCLIEDYNNGFECDITCEFNRICNEKLFQCGSDISCYPVYS